MKQIKRPRSHAHLLKVLSIEQVDAILRATSNVKHTTILYRFSGQGIRLIELLALKLDDILWDRDQLVIGKGKGKKYRYVNRSQDFKQILKLYVHEYTPIHYPFEGQDKVNQYSDRSIQEEVKRAARHWYTAALYQGTIGSCQYQNDHDLYPYHHGVHGEGDASMR